MSKGLERQTSHHRSTDFQGLSPSLSNREKGSEKGNAVPADTRNGANQNVKAGAFDAGKRPAPSRLSIAFELRSLARELRRGPGPLRASPEAILSTKDEVAGRLFQIAKLLEARNV